MRHGSWNMVLLRHDVPDGSWHFDWMLDLDGEHAGLTTFRVWDRPETVQVGASIRAEPLERHRRAYLTYEGEITGGRGRVARVLVGRASLIGAGPEGLEFEAMFEGASTGRWSVPPTPLGGATLEITRFA